MDTLITDPHTARKRAAAQLDSRDDLTKSDSAMEQKKRREIEKMTHLFKAKKPGAKPKNSDQSY